MLRKYKKLYFTAAIGVSLFCTTSCLNELDQVNPNQATEDTFWKDEADFELAMTSCYTPLKNSLNGGYHGTRGVMMRICRADEVEFRNDLSDVYQAMNFTNSNSNSLSQGMFYQIYNALYRTNSIVQKLDEKKDALSSEFINKIKGECLFIRGYYLFQLGKEFCNAPLRLTASQDPATFPLAKSSQAEIWGQAIEDLTTAASLLPIKNEVQGKPTKGAAFACIGKIHVYMKNYSAAIQALEPLTKSPYTYALAPEYDWNFDLDHEMDKNPESVFELIFDDNAGGTDIWGNGELPNSTQSTSRAKEYAYSGATGWYEAWPTNQIMAIMMEEKDKDGNYDIRARKNAAFDFPGCMYYQKPYTDVVDQIKSSMSGSPYAIVKYQNSPWAASEASPPKSCINDRAIRYADVILLLAEANLFSNKLNDAVAYLNQIRSRANLNDYAGAMTQDGVFADLEKQRAIEMFVEGERFYDLRRWGLLEARLKTCNEARYKQYITGKTGSGNKYDYYPIPSKEIQTNPLCEPNEGW